VSSFVPVLLFALGAIALTLAQDAFPAQDWYHGWQYITILGIAMCVAASSAWNARRGTGAARAFAVALVGALLVSGAGLVSGLIGPDTVTVVGTPGTVAPVPDLGVAAFFGAADAATIARGDAPITLRRRGGAVEVGRVPRPFDLSVVVAQPHPAAYVIARDEAGRRVTITQPNNPSFLSPVLEFRQVQPIRDRSFPFDTFAVPALHRIVHTLYFSATDLAAFRHTDAAAGGVIVSVSDEAGKELGLTIAPSGREIAVADLRLTITMGTYPILIAAAAPQPLVTIAGLIVFLGGCVLMLVRRRAQ
jgi:hypothetical protein